MPQEFSAVLVKGRSNYISLRRLDVAVTRQTARSSSKRSSTSSAISGSGPTGPTTARRSDLDFRPLASVWDAVQSENGNCLGRECPRNKECFYFQARRRVWIGQPADRQPRALRDRPGAPGSGLRPPSRVRRRDLRRGPHARSRRRRAHGPPAFEHRRRSHAGPAVQRSDRKGLARPITSFTKPWSRSRVPANGRRRFLRSTSPTGSSRQGSSSTAGSAARSAGPTCSARSCASWPRPSIEAPRQIEKPEQRIELTAAQRPLRALADQIATLDPPDSPTTRSTGSSSKSKRGGGSGWPRPRSTWARACASCCSTRCRPAS